jgi:hypothetical protein
MIQKSFKQTKLLRSARAIINSNMETSDNNPLPTHEITLDIKL